MNEFAKTKCSQCGREILARTAERNDGMCKPCSREANLSESERFEREVFAQIDDCIEPFKSYKNALVDLDSLPRGFKLCFAFHYVNEEILNGGFSQLYGNSTWCLILDAIDATEAAGFHDVSRVLKEAVHYYHQKGRSKLRRRMSDTFLSALDSCSLKSLKELDEEFYDLENSCVNVIPRLCAENRHLFD